MNSTLSMEKLIFDEISFVRNGFQNNDSKFGFHLNVSIGKSKNDLYKVTLKMMGEKKEEYRLMISLTGIFSFDDCEELSDDSKKVLIEKNAVAIMMPYLRSQVSLITAQPDVECVVLPPFNINKLISDE